MFPSPARGRRSPGGGGQQKAPGGRLAAGAIVSINFVGLRFVLLNVKRGERKNILPRDEAEQVAGQPASAQGRAGLTEGASLSQRIAPGPPPPCYAWSPSPSRGGSRVSWAVVPVGAWVAGRGR